MRATHDGPPAHLVALALALAHSYGSTTAGPGARMNGGTGPGPGKACDPHIGPAHVWAGDAENAPVSHLPAKSRVATGLTRAPSSATPSTRPPAPATRPGSTRTPPAGNPAPAASPSPTPNPCPSTPAPAT
ncbi:hypothetical protein ATKI12_9088 [Kitasatospora sp. Ki12]